MTNPQKRPYPLNFVVRNMEVLEDLTVGNSTTQTDQILTTDINVQDSNDNDEFVLDGDAATPFFDLHGNEMRQVSDLKTLGSGSSSISFIDAANGGNTLVKISEGGGVKIDYGSLSLSDYNLNDVDEVKFTDSGSTGDQWTLTENSSGVMTFDSGGTTYFQVAEDGTVKVPENTLDVDGNIVDNIGGTPSAQTGELNLSNDAYVKGRNNADDADVTIVGVTPNDDVTVGNNAKSVKFETDGKMLGNNFFLQEGQLVESQNNSNHRFISGKANYPAQPASGVNANRSPYIELRGTQTDDTGTQSDVAAAMKVTPKSTFDEGFLDFVIESKDALRVDEEGVVYPQAFSQGFLEFELDSTDEDKDYGAFDFTDAGSNDDIRWQRHAGVPGAFTVRSLTEDQNLFEVKDDGDVNVPFGALNVSGALNVPNADVEIDQTLKANGALVLEADYDGSGAGDVLLKSGGTTLATAKQDQDFVVEGDLDLTDGKIEQTKSIQFDGPDRLFESPTVGITENSGDLVAEAVDNIAFSLNTDNSAGNTFSIRTDDNAGSGNESNIVTIDKVKTQIHEGKFRGSNAEWRFQGSNSEIEVIGSGTNIVFKDNSSSNSLVIFENSNRVSVPNNAVSIGKATSTSQNQQILEVGKNGSPSTDNVEFSLSHRQDDQRLRWYGTEDGNNFTDFFDLDFFREEFNLRDVSLSYPNPSSFGSTNEIANYKNSNADVRGGKYDQFTQNVQQTGKQIFKYEGLGTFAIVAGRDPSNKSATRFTDLVLALRGNGLNVISKQSAGSAPTRNYTEASTGTIQLDVGSGSVNVGVVGDKISP